MTRPDTRKPWPEPYPAAGVGRLTPDTSGEIRCRRDQALLAFVEHDGSSRYLRMAPGLMRLGSSRRGDPIRYGLPQRARRGKSPLRRSPPGGWTDLANTGGLPLRGDLRWGIHVYCPNCGKAWFIDTKEFLPSVLDDSKAR